MLHRLLLLILFALPLSAQTVDPDLESALAAAADARAARDVLARALEAGRGEAVIQSLAQEDRLGRWVDWRKGPPGDPLTAAIFGETSFVRLLAGRLQHTEPQRRLNAARLLRWSAWPYLVQVGLDQLSVETDPKVLAALFDAMRGTLKDDELRVVWRSVPLDPAAAAARTHALFRLGLARPGMSHRVAAWPGGPDWVEKGFSGDRSTSPFRALLSGTVSLPRTQNKDPITLLLAFSYDAEGELAHDKMRWLDGDNLLADFTPAEVEAREGLRVIVVDREAGAESDSEDYKLQMAGEGWRRFRFRGLVGFDRALPGRGEPFWTRRLVAGPGLRADNAAPDGAWREGMLLDDDNATFEIDDVALSGKVHSIELDHWSEDPGGSVWEVRLNGVVLMQLIGQPRPRPAKSSLRSLPIEKGKNILELRRLSGKELHLEAIRVRFE